MVSNLPIYFLRKKTFCNFLLADLSTCGLGLGKAPLTDAERGISDPGGGLRSSKELLLSLADAWNVIPVSLVVVSGAVKKHFT